MSGPGLPRSATAALREATSWAGVAAGLAPSTTAAAPATTGVAALVPLNRPPSPLRLVKFEVAERSGLTRSSLVGPQALYGATVTPSHGSTAPIETAPGLLESAAGPEPE